MHSNKWSFGVSLMRRRMFRSAVIFCAGSVNARTASSCMLTLIPSIQSGRSICWFMLVMSVFRTSRPVFCPTNKRPAEPTLFQVAGIQIVGEWGLADA